MGRLRRPANKGDHGSQNKAAAGISAAAIFLSGPTMFQAFSGNLDVINWTDFTFTSPGSCPWHLSGFSGSGFECCYTVQMVLHLVFSGHRLTSFQWMIGFKRAFQDLMGFWFFKGLDVWFFIVSGCLDLGFSDTRIFRISLDVGHLAFRILYLGSSFFLGYWFFSELDLDLVFRIGSFSFADTKM